MYLSVCNNNPESKLVVSHCCTYKRNSIVTSDSILREVSEGLAIITKVAYNNIPVVADMADT